ncbi:hypothetical protein MRB53_004597 [Persea americana]|uniref:Uncharacterized protein n=1 Tax=Persea americana TaxID=3435 RepID=A0ACC2MAW5_PERAE|nr:hypothetical protein MRB53_004597 [Persea americana]
MMRRKGQKEKEESHVSLEQRPRFARAKPPTSLHPAHDSSRTLIRTPSPSSKKARRNNFLPLSPNYFHSLSNPNFPKSQANPPLISATVVWNQLTENLSAQEIAKD